MSRFSAPIFLAALAAAWVLAAPAYVAAQEQVPADGAELPPELQSDIESQETKVDKRKERAPSFDNSRTDINLYNKTVSDPDRVKSVFYTPTEVRDVHLAVNTYLKNIGRGGDLTFDEEAFLSRLGGLKNMVASTTGQSRYFTYPQFFLSSLVYYAPDNWIVWVNGDRITQATPRDSNNIRVLAISPDKVQLEWFPLEMDRVMEIWKSFPNDAVTVDAARRQVTFSLKPNQTFSSYTMSVLEGKVLPVTVDVTKSVMPFNFEEIPPEPEPSPVMDAIVEEPEPTVGKE